MNPFIGRIILMKPNILRFKDYTPNLSQSGWLMNNCFSEEISAEKKIKDYPILRMKEDH